MYRTFNTFCIINHHARKVVFYNTYSTHMYTYSDVNFCITCVPEKIRG